MAENPQPLTGTTITAIQKNAATINSVANAISKATGISITPLGIASPIAREMNKDQIDYPQIFVPFRDAIVSNQWEMSPDPQVPFVAVPATHDSLMQNYRYVQNHKVPNDTNTIEGIYNRLTNPTLNDIGPGKFQIGTAIGLLQSYTNDPRFANDPLDLFKYDGHVEQMVRDLNSNTSATAFDLTSKLSGLMNLQAVEWHTSNQALGPTRWNQYSPEQQAQLITTYYSNGKEKMTNAAGKEIAKFGFYTPDLTSPGSAYVGSGNNMGVMKGALGLQGAIVKLPDGTIEYFDSNGHIIREDSSSTSIDPFTGGVLNDAITKEFDRNGNVIRHTTKTSNVDDGQSDAARFAGSANPIQAPARGQTAVSGQDNDVASTFQPNPTYSAAGNLFGNFPRAAALASAPSPTALDQSGSSAGPWTAADARARLRRALGDAGQFVGNSLITPAEAASPSRPLWPSPTAPDFPSATPIASQPNPAYFSGPNGSPATDANGSEPPAASENFRRLGRTTYSVSPASVFDTGAPAVPFVPSDDANFSGGLLGRLVALAGTAPENPMQPAPLPEDDEPEQANLRALNARLSSSGNIRDAVALYNAMRFSRR